MIIVYAFRIIVLNFRGPKMLTGKFPSSVARDVRLPFTPILMTMRTFSSSIYRNVGENWKSRGEVGSREWRSTRFRRFGVDDDAEVGVVFETFSHPLDNKPPRRTFYQKMLLVSYPSLWIHFGFSSACTTTYDFAHLDGIGRMLEVVVHIFR
jgi:hypothetical protein